MCEKIRHMNRSMEVWNEEMNKLYQEMECMKQRLNKKPVIKSIDKEDKPKRKKEDKKGNIIEKEKITK